MKLTCLCLLTLMCALTCQMSYAQRTRSNTEIRYLSGTGKDDKVLWDFFCTEGRKSGVWTKIGVPSNWETEGFGTYQYGGDRQRETNPFPKEQGKYRTRFLIPNHWTSRTIRLVFEGSMTDTEVWINGKSAGPIHQGSFYQFKYDITPFVEFGKSNLLEITVSKESTNTSVNRAERLGDYWNFGGIFRPVYLEAVPTSFIDWNGIDAKADGSFRIQVNLGGDVASVDQITAQIIDAAGRPFGKPFETSTLGKQLVELATTTIQPKLWTSETPNLYRVRLTLNRRGRAIHTTTERFGFRTFEVRASDGFYLNGTRVLLKGVNRHSFWPDAGRTLSRKISYDDVKLIKEMNMNAVRMSHYPPDAHFLEACDELGLYVLDELAGWQKFYDKPTGARLIGQIVRRDVNHPSIVLWDNGNEGGWNRENDDEFARWDIQRREVLHPWEKFRLTNTDHYEKFDSHTRLANGPDIYLPTEFLHGLYDGGIGAGMWDYWEPIRKSKVGGGAFFWALVDECVKRTDQQGKLDCAGNRGPDGIVGPYREKEGSFTTVREIWSPVQIGPLQPPSGSVVALAVENRYDFTNLKECTFEWRLAYLPVAGNWNATPEIVKAGSVRGPDVAPHSSGWLKIALPKTPFRPDLLHVTARDPKGRELWTWSWPLNDNAVSARRRDTGPVELSQSNGAVSIKAGIFELSFSKQTGELVEIFRNSPTASANVAPREVPIGPGPRFVAFRRNDRKYDDISGRSRLKNFVSRKVDSEVVIEAGYDGPLRQVRWHISGDSSTLNARVEYEYAFDGLVDLIGVHFRASEKGIKKVRWLGRGPYRVWQNRMQGTRLDVWENDYNDTVPGESWIYPEFKGYFRDWRWAMFETHAGTITFEGGPDGSFLGIFKAQDGVNGLLEFPDTGIAFLDAIPAMRNKFHTTDEIGPQSQPKQVSGVVKRHFNMQVGP
jgi:hypothetical protein